MVIFGWMMFYEIIGEIFLYASLLYKIMSLYESVTKRIKIHAYCPGEALLGVIVYKQVSCGAARDNWCEWLCMSHLLKFNPKGIHPLALDK